MVFLAVSVRDGCVLFGSNLRLAPVSAPDVIIVEYLHLGHFIVENSAYTKSPEQLPKCLSGTTTEMAHRED